MHHVCIFIKRAHIFISFTKQNKNQNRVESRKTGQEGERERGMKNARSKSQGFLRIVSARQNSAKNNKKIVGFEQKEREKKVSKRFLSGL